MKDEYPNLDLMTEENRLAIRKIRTEYMKMRILEQQERELLDTMQKETSHGANSSRPANSVVRRSHTEGDRPKRRRLVKSGD